MNSRTIWVAGFVCSVATLTTHARADLAPAPVESCESLPEGARCYERGIVLGHCVHEAIDSSTYVQKRCRIDPVVTPPSSTPSASPLASSLPTALPSATSGPAHGMCSIEPPLDDSSSSDGVAAFGVMLVSATLVRRRARRVSLVPRGASWREANGCATIAP